MSDPFSIDSKRKEVEELFSSVGFSFQEFNSEAFETACEKLQKEKGVEAHTRVEPSVVRAKLTMPEPDGKNYQILFDGELHVS